MAWEVGNPHGLGGGEPTRGDLAEAFGEGVLQVARPGAKRLPSAGQLLLGSVWWCFVGCWCSCLVVF